MELLYQDNEIVVCLKPVGAESEDGKPNAMPALLRGALNIADDAPIYTVHRLDKQVGGVMVYAKTKAAAAALSAQMQAHQFTKEYRAVIEGRLQDYPTHLSAEQPTESDCPHTENNRNNAKNVPCGTTSTPHGRWEDLLYHDKRKNKVFTVKKERKGVKHAALRYEVLGQGVANGTPCTLLKIELETGRTHQIRVQCASRKHPLIGDGRYGSQIKGCDIALFSHKIGFAHPKTGERMTFTAQPPAGFPWGLCSASPAR